MTLELVNNGVRPQHYKNGIQPLHLFQEIDETDGNKFCLQNAIKYLNRDELKNNRVSDVAKLGDYIGYVTDSLKEEGFVPEMTINMKFLLGKDFAQSSDALKSLLMNALINCLVYLDENDEILSMNLSDAVVLYDKYFKLVKELESVK